MRCRRSRAERSPRPRAARQRCRPMRRRPSPRCLRRPGCRWCRCPTMRRPRRLRTSFAVSRPSAGATSMRPASCWGRCAAS
ncbi:MAG: hypothetical protein E6Q92_02970 [Burkholderiaceae bacterium]|nr:MAG: hypothetical protein E6Q92_02970 [Burkholderiaceae bacterium]